MSSNAGYLWNQRVERRGMWSDCNLEMGMELVLSDWPVPQGGQVFVEHQFQWWFGVVLIGTCDMPMSEHRMSSVLMLRVCLGCQPDQIVMGSFVMYSSCYDFFIHAYHIRTDPTFSLRTLDVTMTSSWHHSPMTSFLHHYDLILHLWYHLPHYDVIDRTL